MNGKFSNMKKALAVFVCALMLVQCAALGAVAAEIAPEAVVYTRPEVISIEANQIGVNFVDVDIKTLGAGMDQTIIVYFTEEAHDVTDGYENWITLSYTMVDTARDDLETDIIEGDATAKLGVPDAIGTGTYNITVALNKAADVVKSTVFYIGVETVKGFFETINITDADVLTVAEKLDAHYEAIATIAYTEDEDGNIILKLTGDDYEALSEAAQLEFAELILNGVNGKYSENKGSYDETNSESFIKEAYLTAAYNAKGFTEAEFADVLYRFSSVVGFEATEETIYGKIQDKASLVKVMKTMASKVDDVEEIAEVLEQAAAVQLINETYAYNLVNVLEAENALFGIDEDEIKEVQASKKLRDAFCEEFRAIYYSVDEIREGWEDAYKAAKRKIANASSGNTGGGGGTGAVTTNKVNTQITNSENNKDPNVAIADYYTDMGSYSWASDAILNLTKAGIVSGYGDKTFAPGNSVTRAEFMKMLVNVFALADITATTSFTDVSKDSWYYIYVASAEKCGIAQGYGNGLFGVNDPVTRQDAITMIYRAATVKGMSLEHFKGSANNLLDKDYIAAYAYPAVEALYKTGVYLDASDPTSINVFEPARNASRAYLAVVLNQIYNYIK